MKQFLPQFSVLIGNENPWNMSKTRTELLLMKSHFNIKLKWVQVLLKSIFTTALVTRMCFQQWRLIYFPLVSFSQILLICFCLRLEKDFNIQWHKFHQLIGKLTGRNVVKKRKNKNTRAVKIIYWIFRLLFILVYFFNFYLFYFLFLSVCIIRSEKILLQIKEE